MRVLGIPVDTALVDQWRRWLLAAEQPFRVPTAIVSSLGLEHRVLPLTMESADAFELYATSDRERVVTVDRRTARLLPADVRAAQPAAHRWPTGDVSRDAATAVAFVERGVVPCRRHAVDAAQWHRVSDVLPDARRIAGRFADRSGPNCFGAVMAAAGVSAADEVWMQIEPFEAWLGEHTVPGGDDRSPGTVLVWRDRAGRPAHAAVTLGGGMLLHKPSQGWMSPTMVLTVREGIFAVRRPGLRLSRRRLRWA